MKTIHVKGYTRKCKGGKVIFVKGYSRSNESTTQKKFSKDILMDFIGEQDFYGAESRAERYYPEDIDRATLIAGLTNTHIYNKLLKEKDTYVGKMLCKKADEFVETHKDYKPIEVFSGINLPISKTKEIGKGVPFNEWGGVPLYTSRYKEEAYPFMGKTSSTDIACVLKINAHKGGGVNTKSLSIYPREEEHLFSSKTQLKVTGKPTKKFTSEGAIYWEVPCDIIY